MERRLRGQDALYDTHASDFDDARSETSVSSYMCALNPPLTARLPPAVRARSSSTRSSTGNMAPGNFDSSKRLSQLEKKLREMEQEDWRTDRLIISGSRDTLGIARKADQASLPSSSAVAGSGMYDDLYQEKNSRSRPQIREWEQHSTVRPHLNSTHLGHADPPAHRQRIRPDAEPPLMRTPNYFLSNQRLAELSQSESNPHSFGSPFSPVDSILQVQTPSYCRTSGPQISPFDDKLKKAGEHGAHNI
jgi:hypothetical protein